MPLDTSKLPADQRLPPYPYGQPGLLLQQGQKPLHQAQGAGGPQQGRQPPQQQQQQQHIPPQCPYPATYQPNSGFQHQLNQPLGDYGLGRVSVGGGAKGGVGLGGGACPRCLLAQGGAPPSFLTAVFSAV